ncbi:transcriptional regulator [Paracoccus methylovorus]|uniref:Transcriptional regulator n=1 Tax=Paracoccus methylovorus TaxID=2812658 RepID=A0ABX7JP13_9RHOB|nr:transcriptional regulator [Paracoccus methylovorus]QRZ15404.1 transcriptional regulator [Paracoccus methylovorus]
MARRPALGDRPPAYPDKSTLAAELCVSEATVDDWTKKGILPKPCRLAGSVRWCWADVEAKLTPPAGDPVSPFQKVLHDVI